MRLIDSKPYYTFFDYCDWYNISLDFDPSKESILRAFIHENSRSYQASAYSNPIDNRADYLVGMSFQIISGAPEKDDNGHQLRVVRYLLYQKSKVIFPKIDRDRQIWDHSNLRNFILESDPPFLRQKILAGYNEDSVPVPYFGYLNASQLEDKQKN